jgi:hypothetical protein
MRRRLAPNALRTTSSVSRAAARARTGDSAAHHHHEHDDEEVGQRPHFIWSPRCLPKALRVREHVRLDLRVRRQMLRSKLRA